MHCVFHNAALLKQCKMVKNGKQSVHEIFSNEFEKDNATAVAYRSILLVYGEDEIDYSMVLEIQGSCQQLSRSHGTKPYTFEHMNTIPNLS